MTFISGGGQHRLSYLISLYSSRFFLWCIYESWYEKSVNHLSKNIKDWKLICGLSFLGPFLIASIILQNKVWWVLYFFMKNYYLLFYCLWVLNFKSWVFCFSFERFESCMLFLKLVQDLLWVIPDSTKNCRNFLVIERERERERDGGRERVNKILVPCMW